MSFNGLVRDSDCRRFDCRAVSSGRRRARRRTTGRGSCARCAMRCDERQRCLNTTTLEISDLKNKMGLKGHNRDGRMERLHARPNVSWALPPRTLLRGRGDEHVEANRPPLDKSPRPPTHSPPRTFLPAPLRARFAMGRLCPLTWEFSAAYGRGSSRIVIYNHLHRSRTVLKSIAALGDIAESSHGKR
jgi:hypothetical protein